MIFRSKILILTFPLIGLRLGPSPSSHCAARFPFWTACSTCCPHSRSPD
jgi:hypothetical protein